MRPALSLESITTDVVSFGKDPPISVDVLRLDKISADISGNKWFKLRYYSEMATAQHKKGILTFGGAWSNHILATAATCKLHGLQSVGIIRGEAPPDLSPSLSRSMELGMQLFFISRDAYRRKKIPPHIHTKDLLVVDEGGYGAEGARGASTILDYCSAGYTDYCCAVGTGTMMAGIINAATKGQRITGISVLKNNLGIDGMIRELLHEQVRAAEQSASPGWQIIHDYSFGGYAKYTPQLTGFMNRFYTNTGIPSDFVYTGKLFFAISELARQNYFPTGSKILVVHSGGLQGNLSLPAGTLIF